MPSLRNTKWLWAIILVAVVLRAGAALYMGDSVYDLPGVFDQISYDALAQRVASGHGFSFGADWWPATRAGEPTAFWSFPMTLYLAAIYKLFGYHPLIARLVQAVIAGVMMPLLTYRLAARAANRTVGLVAAGISAVYVYFFYYAGALMTETFYISGILASLNLAVAVAREPSRGRWLALGLAAGCAVLFRQTYLLFVPFLLLWIGWARGRGAVGVGAAPAQAEQGAVGVGAGLAPAQADRGAVSVGAGLAPAQAERGAVGVGAGLAPAQADRGAVGVAPAQAERGAVSVGAGLAPAQADRGGCKARPYGIRFAIPVAVIALMILPWTIRNFRAFHQLVLLNTNAGFAFFWANHPIHGTSFISLLGPGQPSYHDLIPAELLPLDEAALDKALLARGLGFVADDPLRYILLSVSRIEDYFIFWPKADSSTLSNISRVGSFGICLPFMVYGLLLSLREFRGGHGATERGGRGTTLLLLYLFIVVYTGVHLLSWAGVRYRLPVDAVLVVFAAIGLVDLWRRLFVAGGPRRVDEG